MNSRTPSDSDDAGSESTSEVCDSTSAFTESVAPVTVQEKVTPSRLTEFVMVSVRMSVEQAVLTSDTPSISSVSGSMGPKQ